MDELDFTLAPRDKIYDPAIARTCFEALGKPESVAEGEFFFEHDQASDRMYLLLDGQVRLIRGEKTLDFINPGEIFGELAVISGHPRTASAVAKAPCRALSLDAKQFEQAIQETPDFALMLMGILIDRLRMSVAILDKTGNLPDRSAKDASSVFDKALLGELSVALKQRSPQPFPAGRTIMKEGEIGGFMYVVVKGSVAVSIKSKVVERVSPGGVFGEMALVDQSPRAASAIAETDTELVPVNREDLLLLVKTNPAFAVSLLRSITMRLRRMIARRA
jgi:CRP/FNR family cyclic AMP-dependent transcriptional regulator